VSEGTGHPCRISAGSGVGCSSDGAVGAAVSAAGTVSRTGVSVADGIPVQPASNAAITRYNPILFWDPRFLTMFSAIIKTIFVLFIT
jgi:hypothetical protein